MSLRITEIYTGIDTIRIHLSESIDGVLFEVSPRIPTVNAKPAADYIPGRYLVV